MSSFTIRQRTRENQIVKTYTGSTIATSIGPVTGIDTDGGSFWLTSQGSGLTSGVFSQIELPSASVLREVTLGFNGNGTWNQDLCNDGENFNLLHGLGSIGNMTLMNRQGTPLQPIPGLAISTEATGVAFDGDFYYVVHADPFGFTPPFIAQYDRSSSTFVLVRSVTLGLGSAGGLVFDGEFLVTHPIGANMDLIYLDRRNMDVVKTAGGEAYGASHREGMTYDGEYIYTLESNAE